MKKTIALLPLWLIFVILAQSLLGCTTNYVYSRGDGTLNEVQFRRDSGSCKQLALAHQWEDFFDLTGAVYKARVNDCMESRGYTVEKGR